jgi:hypothetical protein
MRLIAFVRTPFVEVTRHHAAHAGPAARVPTSPPRVRAVQHCVFPRRADGERGRRDRSRERQPACNRRHRSRRQPHRRLCLSCCRRVVSMFNGRHELLPPECIVGSFQFVASHLLEFCGSTEIETVPDHDSSYVANRCWSSVRTGHCTSGRNPEAAGTARTPSQALVRSRLSTSSQRR